VKEPNIIAEKKGCLGRFIKYFYNCVTRKLLKTFDGILQWYQRMILYSCEV